MHPLQQLCWEPGHVLTMGSCSARPYPGPSQSPLYSEAVLPRVLARPWGWEVSPNAPASRLTFGGLSYKAAVLHQ